MNSDFLRLCCALLLLVLSGRVAFSETGAGTHECARGHFLLAAPDAADYRKYAPSREVDILHLALDVTPNFARRTVAGRATVRFKPIATPLAFLKLDAVELTVSNVTS